MKDKDDIMILDEDSDVEFVEEEDEKLSFNLMGPQFLDDLVYMSRIDRLVLNESLLKLQTLHSELEVTTLRMEKLEREHRDRMAALSNRVGQLKKSIDEKKENHDALMAEMTSLYKVDFSCVFYDDETGLLRTQDDHELSIHDYKKMTEDS